MPGKTQPLPGMEKYCPAHNLRENIAMAVAMEVDGEKFSLVDITVTGESVYVTIRDGKPNAKHLPTVFSRKKLLEGE